jgi:hypothetical protein
MAQSAQIVLVFGATAIDFEHTQVRTAQVSLDANSGSQEAGELLARALPHSVGAESAVLRNIEVRGRLETCQRTKAARRASISLRHRDRARRAQMARIRL